MLFVSSNVRFRVVGVVWIYSILCVVVSLLYMLVISM